MGLCLISPIHNSAPFHLFYRHCIYTHTYVFARKMIALAGQSVGVLRLERDCRLCSAAPTFAVASTAEKTGLHVDMGPPANTIDTIQTHIFLFVCHRLIVWLFHCGQQLQPPATVSEAPGPLLSPRRRCSCTEASAPPHSSPANLL